MTGEEIGVVLKRFEHPDEVRHMEKGRFELVRIGGMTIGRATYEPGWRWSEHVGPSRGQKLCPVEHVGVVLSGTATVMFGEPSQGSPDPSAPPRAATAFADGTVMELTAGTVFYIPQTPHDSWVVGDEPYVSLHLLGADHYAR